MPSPSSKASAMTFGKRIRLDRNRSTRPIKATIIGISKEEAVSDDTSRVMVNKSLPNGDHSRKGEA